MPGVFDFIPDLAGIDRVLHAPDGDVTRYLLQLGHETEAIAVENLSGIYLNVDTGRLRSSVTTVVADGGNVVMVGTNVFYGKVHELAGIHWLSDALELVLGRH